MRTRFFNNRVKPLALFSILIAAVTMSSAATYVPQSSNRVNINLDTGWLFIKADNSAYSSKTADESSFKPVCLPHANAIIKHAYQAQDSFRIVTWYRRHFTPPSTYSGRRFLLEFQAVSTVGTAYVNGTQVAVHQGAYTPFTVDITSNVTVGADNVIAVQVDSKQHTDIPPEGNANMDFYIFGGIVRHVNLYVTDPLHVSSVFAYITNPSQTAPSNPPVYAKTLIVNNNAAQKTCTVITNIVDVNNNVVATASTQQSVPANGSYTFSQTTSAISNPNLWHPDHPYLYTVYTQVEDGSTFVDEYKTRTGLRSLTMSKTDGKCYVNGQPLKLRGLNRHETFPFFGRAASKRLQRKDADILKYDMGCNMVRTSHYPQAPDFLDRCDEVGILLLEEIPGWNYLGNANWKAIEMQTLVDMVVRDRNHPSILTWGVRPNESVDDTWYQLTNDSARFYDPTRLTCGVRNGNGDDVAYFYEDIWTRNFLTPSANPPEVPVITTEDIGHGYPIASFSVEDSLNQEWQLHAAAHDASYGQSIWGGLLGWCAFDYNSSHPNAVSLTGGRYVSPHGQADIFRIRKFSGYFYQSQSDPTLYGPMVHIMSYWKSNSPVSPTLFVASNCDSVELFVNGVSQGMKSSGYWSNLPHPVFGWPNVTYAAGNLKANGYAGGALKATETWYTPGTATKLVMVPDTTVIFEGGDMTRVVVEAVDANNQYVPYNSATVTLSANGAGDFIGESPIALEDGKTCFYVKTRASATGAITCNATATGLTAASSTITVINGDATSIGERARFPSAQVIGTHTTMFRTVMNSRFILPEWAKKGAQVSVYTLAGRLVCRTGAVAGTLDLEKFGTGKGIYLVEITGNIQKN
ncbi:MAG: glycoside hydrolase family 2 TIM barrel-domain containing protein [Chitinivibrionales bacterium]